MTTSVKALREMARSFVLSAVGAFTRPPKTSFLRPLFFHDVEQSEVENFCAVLRRLKSVGKFIDTRTCVSMLEGQTPIKGAHFHLSFDDGNRSLTALKAGFRACFGAARGQIVPGRTDASWIPRHHLEAGWPWSHVKSFVLGFGEE
ncbi:MAG: hypothetical protein HY277_02005 [Ignavibacteriales bacterium]|nr:hypothetical protein [Ignavibacteriales bacterium]